MGDYDEDFDNQPMFNDKRRRKNIGGNIAPGTGNSTWSHFSICIIIIIVIIIIGGINITLNSILVAKKQVLKLDKDCSDWKDCTLDFEDKTNGGCIHHDKKNGGKCNHNCIEHSTGKCLHGECNGTCPGLCPNWFDINPPPSECRDIVLSPFVGFNIDLCWKGQCFLIVEPPSPYEIFCLGTDSGRYELKKRLEKTCLALIHNSDKNKTCYEAYGTCIMDHPICLITHKCGYYSKIADGPLSFATNQAEIKSAKDEMKTGFTQLNDKAGLILYLEANWEHLKTMKRR